MCVCVCVCVRACAKESHKTPDQVHKLDGYIIISVGSIELDRQTLSSVHNLTTLAQVNLVPFPESFLLF